MVIVSIILASSDSLQDDSKDNLYFCGKPLINWTIEQSMASEGMTHTFVATKDDENVRIAQKYGVSPMSIPHALSIDLNSGSNIISYIFRILQHDLDLSPDIVVILQDTSPLRKSNDIHQALSMFLDSKADSLFSGSKMDNFPIWIKKKRVKLNDNLQYIENGSIYMIKPQVNENHIEIIRPNSIIYEMEFWQSLKIENLKDIPLLEFYYNSNLKSESTPKPRLDDIELIAMDFDGVHTDNKVLTTEKGVEGVWVNRSDGLAISEFKKLNIPLVIISTETNNVVRARAKKLQIQVLKGLDDKEGALKNYCKKRNINLKNTIFIGNDVNDLAVLECVGWPICPMDAYPEIKNISKIILPKNGGDGVIRELLELLYN